MCTTPYTVPNTPPSACVDTGNGTAYDNADWAEALVFGHMNATHLPNADTPFFDPDTMYSYHIGGVNLLFGDGSVHFIASTVSPYAYQYLATIAGGEVGVNW
jgi:prepilin-type processing-associated H-X9-DG protein